MQDDHDLLARAYLFDHEALGQIHDQHYEPVFRYVVFRVGDVHLAEDLTGEVFMRLLAALRDGKAPRQSLKGWLFSVAANVISDHFRRHYRARMIPLADTLESEGESPIEAVEALLTQTNLKRAIAQLTDEQQHVIALRFGEGLSIKETADIMGKREGAVKQMQARALSALYRLLAQEDSQA